MNSWYCHSLNLTDISLLCVISVQIAKKKHKNFECHGHTRWFRLIAIFTNSKVWAAMRFSSSLSLAPSTIAGRLSSRHEQWTWKFWTNLRHFFVAKSQRDYVLELERTTDYSIDNFPFNIIIEKTYFQIIKLTHYALYSFQKTIIIFLCVQSSVVVCLSFNC